MSWNSNLRKGTDLPTWDWLSFLPDQTSYPGTSISYDNFRYLYVANQSGTTSNATTSTTNLWKYDTWSDGWHRLQTLTGIGNGADLRYDPVRNVLHLLNGGATNTWQIFSLNSSSVLANGNTAILGTTYQPYATASAGPVTPATNQAGSNLSFPEDVTFGEPFATGTVASATSTTVFHDTLTSCLINAAHVGCAIRFTSGSNVGVRRIISAFSFTKGNPVTTMASGVANGYTLAVNTPLGITTGMNAYGRGIGYAAEVTSVSGSTVTLSVAHTGAVNTTITFIQEFANITTSSAFTNIPQNGDAYIVEYPTGSISAAYSTTTIYDATANWTVNMYRDSDVVIVSGSNVGVRRRIASNTASVLTLTAATAGSNRTGPLPAVPDATSVYKIVPSSDFLYEIAGNGSAGFYRIDINQTSASSWTPLTAITGTAGAGAQLFHGQKAGPFSLFCVRGNGTNNIYRYDIGLQTWSNVNPSLGTGNPYYGPADTLSTGAHACILSDFNRIALHYQSTTRIYALRLSDGFLEPLGTTPYTAGSAYDGNRMKNIVSLDGVSWLYFQRPGGGEFYRYALEHLP